MVKAELLKWYASIEKDKMPRYIEISDANESQIFFNGCWQNVIYVWSILFDGKNWKYVETDSDRGYVFDLKSFCSENEAVEYAKDILNKKLLASKGNSRFEMLQRYIQQKYGYSDKRASSMLNQMILYDDIFEEFFNYARVGKFCKKDKTQTQVCGYTAETLHCDYNLSPLGAYNYLVYLKEDPNNALTDLKELLKGGSGVSGAALKQS